MNNNSLLTNGNNISVRLKGFSFFVQIVNDDGLKNDKHQYIINKKPKV